MRLITRNYRALDNGLAICGLLDVQKREAPDRFSLSETKHYGKWMDWLRWKLEMPNMIIVNSVGVGGGLALFWKKDIDIDIDICLQSLSKYHIDSIVKEEDGLQWKFTWIYGEPSSEAKRQNMGKS
jgi:hypothetical protein